MSGVREKLRLFLAFLTSSKDIALLFFGRGLQPPKYHPPPPQQRPPISWSFPPPPPPPPPPVLFLGSAAKKAPLSTALTCMCGSLCAEGGRAEKRRGDWPSSFSPCPSSPPPSPPQPSLLSSPCGIFSFFFSFSTCPFPSFHVDSSDQTKGFFVPSVLPRVGRTFFGTLSLLLLL